MTRTQKSSWRDEYSISCGRNSAWRISSLLNTRPSVRLVSSRASVVLPLPGSPARTMIMGENKVYRVCSEICRLLTQTYCRDRSIWLLPRNQVFGHAPFCIPTRNHDVEDPLMALFFGFDQTNGLHVEKVVFHPANLLLAHSTALQVDGY